MLSVRAYIQFIPKRGDLRIFDRCDRHFAIFGVDWPKRFVVGAGVVSIGDRSDLDDQPAKSK